MIQSKAWERLIDNPLATGQRWYCKCGARFKTAWGQVVELQLRGETIYFRAAVPDHIFQDIRALSYESKYKPLTPLELYHMVPEVKPITGAIIEPLEGTPGHFQLLIKPQELQEFKWHQIFIFLGVPTSENKLQKTTDKNGRL